MAKDHEEIAEDERDEEDALDDEEEADEDDESGEDESEDEDDAEDDEDDESDSDDEAELPKTRKALNEAIARAVRDALKGDKNRSSRNQRASGKGNDQNKSRTGKPDQEVESLKGTVAQLQRNEEKRQFGYANGLTPDEVDVVFKLRKNPTPKSLKNPIIQGALEGYRNARRLKENTPRAGGAGRPTRQAARDEKNMTSEEKQTRFADRRRQILAGK